MLKGLIFATCMVAGASAAYGYAQKDTDAAICPDRLTTGTGSLLCSCPTEATAGGSVWGDSVYTDDSAICRSALHAGAIGTDGGMVYVVEAPGQSSYPAVTRNSVASSAWTTAWNRSIAFRPVSEAGGAARMAEACPFNVAGLGVGTRLTCGCPASAAGSGSVWGSGPYTGDSAMCRAAVHAGAIGERGGTIRVRVGAGRATYSGSTRNGVGANSWGSYGTSLEIER
jgi:hypothetical protein